MEKIRKQISKRFRKQRKHQEAYSPSLLLPATELESSNLGDWSVHGKQVMTVSCPDDLSVGLRHAASAPDGNMDEDSAVQVAKCQDETEINNLPFKPSETEVICWFRNAEEGLQRERKIF